MENELVSVIVPVYKVEPYLDKCVESIVNQSYTNLEIILVDDGSPDNCPAMCDAWAAKDSRIRVIHKENEGVAEARNIGLKEARGSYIAFVDSDDWVEKQFLQVLVSLQNVTQAEIVACNFRHVTENENPDLVKVIAVPEYHLFGPEKAMDELIENRSLRSVVWNKLYVRALLEKEKFPKGKIHEDEHFSFRVIGKAKRLAYTDTVLYNYLQREGSIMHVSSVQRLDALDVLLQRLDYLEEHYRELYEKSKVYFCIECAAAYHNAKNIQQKERAQYREKVKAYRGRIRFSCDELKKYGIKQIAYIWSSKFAIRLMGAALHWRSRSIQRKGNA